MLKIFLIRNFLLVFIIQKNRYYTWYERVYVVYTCPYVSGLQNVNVCLHQLIYTHKHAHAASMPEKVAELERQTTASNPNGTFGFSVLGGAGTKFPAVVCEVDRGGPADRSGKVYTCMLTVGVGGGVYGV